jgi:hypothetical protein
MILRAEWLRIQKHRRRSQTSSSNHARLKRIVMMSALKMRVFRAGSRVVSWCLLSAARLSLT